MVYARCVPLGIMYFFTLCIYMITSLVVRYSVYCLRFLRYYLYFMSFEAVIAVYR